MTGPGTTRLELNHHDGTRPSNFKPLSDEDREFLEKAMEEAFGKIEDPNKIMQEAIAQINSKERTDESIATALEVMDKCCDDVDCARNIEKLNGLQPLIDLLETHSGAIRVRTLEVLALLFSNNPNIQQAGVKRGAMKACLKIISDCPKASEERGKAFRALVALVRQVEVFEETLLRGAGGVGIILSFLEPDEEARSREKAASFVRSLATDGRFQADEAVAIIGAITQLIRGITDEGLQYREMAAESLHELLRAFPGKCTPETKEAVVARMVKLKKAQDADTETELSSLEQCLAFAGESGAAAPAA
eukprot:CAMPEP_0113818390 /NCGR_PEP_ID=MMETSP0328-20130328/216_1 /TAXON_ID=39455 /ORGANISM="Alexandrium minutum" /LENGTH=305 /DNA_ID=CAMNT_0000786325 /DNA_START=123 /DNA_END=1041 /DNA_ORIENTATION=+ /assembly_acc=CAM_ASM_000350